MIEKGDFDIDRIVTPKETQAETTDDFEVSLRPKTLDEYIGQEKVKENLKIYIQAAKNRGDSLDHVLLYGPPGLGKTTLSAIIAHEMGVNIRITSGPAIEKPGDLAALLTNLEKATCFLSTRFTAFQDRWRKFFILPLKIMPWI